jgi:hypothetical protein
VGKYAPIVWKILGKNEFLVYVGSNIENFSENDDFLECINSQKPKHHTLSI